MEALNFPGSEEDLRKSAFESAPTACVVVTHTGTVVAANARARAFFGFTPQDLGRPVEELAPSSRSTALQSLLLQAYTEHQTITLHSVKWGGDLATPQYFDIEATPLYDPAARCLGASLSFLDVTRRERLQEQLQSANDEQEVLRQRFAKTTAELLASREEMHTLNEELQMDTEELQTSNEELQTTNEELQTTVEELQTNNEELQTANEELQVLNTKLCLQSSTREGTNLLLRAILAGVREPVIIVDRQLKVLAWNHAAEDMWGPREHEIREQPLRSLDIGLPVARLPLAELLDGKSPREDLSLAAINRRGRAIRCHIVMTPFTNALGEREGVVLTMEEQGKQ